MSNGEKKDLTQRRKARRGNDAGVTEQHVAGF
jgi:hypothetical protein